MDTFTTTQKRLSVILKAVTVLSALLGTVLSAYASRDTFMGGRVVFMYFTIQSNIAIALICAAGLYLLLRGKQAGTLWYIIKFVGTVSITLNGAVVCFMLAPTLGNSAWNLQNILTHVIVPAAAILDFFVTGTGSSIRKRSTFWVIVPPVLYVIYAGIGFAAGWQFAPGYNYPYFFLNWGSPAGAFGFTDELPYMGCVWWILVLLCALLLTGYLYLVLIDLLKKRKTKQSQSQEASI